MGLVASLVGLLVRVAFGLAVALVLALVIALLSEETSFTPGFAIGCIVIGCITLLMAFGGSSPSRRMGVQDPWFASFFPRLVRPMGAQYARTRLSDSAVFALTAIVLLVVGVVLLG